MIRHAPSIGLGIGLSLRGYSGVAPGFSPEALNYFSRLDTAGDTTYTAYKQPLANYIDGLIAQSMWNGLASAASFVGVGIEGVTVPLRSDMPVLTNNNFVGADLSVTDGLKGDGSTKYLATGVIGTDLAQDNAAVSAYITALPTIDNSRFLGQGFATGDVTMRYSSASSLLDVIRMQSSSSSAASLTISTGSAIGANRASAASYIERAGGVESVSSITSTTPTSTGVSVFAGGSGSAPTDARLATYTAGESIDLAALETLQATLIAEIKSAAAVAAAADYFSRLVAAGDTTHVAYKTPLTNYITGLIQNDMWDGLASAASFVGVGIEGVTVPLRSDMPVLTNNNFVGADLSVTDGLKGDGSTKYLATGVIGTDLAQNDASCSVYATETLTNNNYYLFGESGPANCGLRRNILTVKVNSNEYATASTPLAGLLGATRSDGTNLTYRESQSSATVATASVASGATEYVLFAFGAAGSSYGDPRIATYHLGDDLDLATLETLQATLIAEIAAI